MLLTRNETSPDGSHGQGVIHAAWTADSQFFVAGTVATGGHQPWAHPIWFYARAAGKVVDLAKFGVTPNADFSLEDHDVVKTTVPGCGGKDPSRTISVNLRDLMTTRSLRVPPCPIRSPDLHERLAVGYIRVQSAFAC